MNAIQLYSTYFPDLIDYPLCLFNLGVIYAAVNRLQEAEERYLQAAQLYSAYFPHSIKYAYCLYNLGKLYEDMERPVKAEEWFIKAIQLCSVHFPHSIQYPMSLYNLAVIYGNSGRREDAVTKIKEARQLFAQVGTKSDLDRCDQMLQLL